MERLKIKSMQIKHDKTGNIFLFPPHEVLTTQKRLTDHCMVPKKIVCLENHRFHNLHTTLVSNSVFLPENESRAKLGQTNDKLLGLKIRNPKILRLFIHHFFTILLAILDFVVFPILKHTQMLTWKMHQQGVEQSIVSIT